MADDTGTNATDDTTPDDVAADAGDDTSAVAIDDSPLGDGVGDSAGDTPRGELTITLNGTEVDAHPGELVITAAERHGVYIPHFCYHPRMRPVGMCRMCIVEIDTGRGPALQPSCMLECTEGMTVDTTSEVTTKAQDGILEFLLINHPLDCPVCDKGGECPLQDQTMAYGPGESRFVESKRHHEKPIPISDLVLLDRERCILCDRCTRFAKEVAGDPLIHFINRGGHTEINTFPDEPFASYFSGNTVQICPVGALTATPYRFKARPWDLEQAESTCQTCSVGCRVAVQSSRNEVLRYLGVDSDPVNWGWLCDKGRFAFESVNSPDRLTEPLVRTNGELTSARWTDALRLAAGVLREAVDDHGPGSIGVLGGARLTNEDAYAWAKLVKGVLGCDNVDAQLGDGLPPGLVLGAPAATIDDVCTPGGTVVLVGPDVKEELPVLYLRLRHAAVEDGVRIIEIVPAATGLSPYTAATLVHRPGEGADTARALVGAAGLGPDAGGVDAGVLDTARQVLAGATGPVMVVAGRGSLAESDAFTADAVGALLSGLDGARVLPALRRGNVRGALEMGLAPGLLPGRVALGAGATPEGWPGVPEQPGLDATGILEAACDGRIRTLVLLGADPVSDHPDTDLVDRALAAADVVIATDTFLTASSQRADVVLPAAGFAEVAGTTTNLEGRVTVVHQKVTPPGTAQSDWIIAAKLAMALGADLGLESPADITDEIARVAPSHAGLTTSVLADPSRSDGVVAPLDPAGGPGPGQVAFDAPGGVPLAPRDAYALRLVASRRLYDEGVAVQASPSMAALPPGAVVRLSPADANRLGVASGDPVRLSGSRSASEVTATIDPALAAGSVGIWFNQPGVSASAYIDATEAVTTLQVETLGRGGQA